MSELEKFKLLFDEIGIKYMESRFSDTIALTVDESAIADGYCVGLDIWFSEDGKFKVFITSGE